MKLIYNDQKWREFKDSAVLILTMSIPADISDLLQNLASMSCMKFKHAACIVLHGKIVSYGLNVQHNNMIPKKCKYSSHAEEVAINKLPKSMYSKYSKSMVMYIIRVSAQKDMVYSKPCIDCEHLIKKYKIAKIYYS